MKRLKVGPNVTVTSKLSRLQKYILKAAIANAWNGNSVFSEWSGDVHLYKYEILEGYFHFEPPIRDAYDLERVRNGEFRKARRWRAGDLNHDPDQQLGGWPQYQSAHASVSRAITRLENRGLLTRCSDVSTRRWTGLRLTKDGVTVAERLARSWV